MLLVSFPSLFKNYRSRDQFTLVSVKSCFSVRVCWKGNGEFFTTRFPRGSLSSVIGLIYIQASLNHVLFIRREYNFNQMLASWISNFQATYFDSPAGVMINQ